MIDYESEAYSSGYRPAKLQYPLSDKDRHASKIQFEIIETTPPTFAVNFRSLLNWTEEGRVQTSNQVNLKKLEVIETGKKAELYIPQSHAVTEVFGYQTPDLGISGGTGAAMVEQGADIGRAISAAATQGFQGISNLVGAFNGTELGRLGIVRAASAAPIGDKGRAAISVVARTSLHPNTRAIFERTQIRKFTFQFKFIPRSKAESDQVKQIIHFFRFHAHPEEINVSPQGGGFTVPVGYKFPDMFRIKMYTKLGAGAYKRTGTKMLDCFLEGITTNYNPQMAVYHADGSPVEIDLTLNFMENRALSRNDLEGAEPSSSIESTPQYSYDQVINDEDNLS